MLILIKKILEKNCFFNTLNALQFLSQGEKMSLAIDAESNVSDIEECLLIKECSFQWEEKLPQELREEATVVFKLALQLFEKIKTHSQVDIPSDKNSINDWCRFFWYNPNQFGSIGLNKEIKTTEEGQRKELANMAIKIIHEDEIGHPPYVDNIAFNDEASEFFDIMPLEFRKECAQLIKVASMFFTKLIQHTDVLIKDGGCRIADWEHFYYHDMQGIPCGYIAFSDQLNTNNRLQRLVIAEI